MKLQVKLLSFAAALMSLMTACVNEGIQDPQDAANLKLIPALEEQAAAVEASVKDFQNLQLELEANDVELSGNAVEALEQHVADLKKGGLSLEEGTLAAFELQKKLGAIVGSALAELDADKYDSKLKRSVNALENGVKMWVGESFNVLYPAAVAEARVKASVISLDSKLANQKLYVDALLSDVEAGFRKDEKPEELKGLAASVNEALSNSKKLSDDLSGLTAEVSKEYAEAVASVLSDPAGFDGAALKEFNANAGLEVSQVDDSLSGLSTRVAACEAQLADIHNRLGVLEETVGTFEELLGMIQSVNLLTEYSAAETVAKYEMGSKNVEGEDYKERTPQGTIELNYIVRPAAAADALAAESLWNNSLKVFGYYANRIEQSAVGEFVDFNITNVVADSQTGVVTITIENNLNADFYYKKTGAKMALSVKTGKTDLTSQFVEIVPKDASTNVYLESLSLEKEYVEMDEGSELNLRYTISPSNVTNKELVWESANWDNVFVSGEGRLTAKTLGTTKITVTSKGTDEWGRTLSATCTVKVNPAVRLSGPPYVESGKEAELILDYPSSMVIESKEWSTSDASKATVSSAGVVTGVGHTYNTATEDYNTITVYCKINGNVTVSHEMKVVVTQPSSIKLNNYADDVSDITIKVDESLDLGATIVPEVPADQFRLFYKSTYDLGWIDSATGKVNANKNVAGVAYVYIEVMDYDKSHYFAPGKSLKRTVIVRVNPYYVKSIKLNDVDLEPGQTVTLSPQFSTDVAGKQPTNTAVTWTSSNTAVATVDQNGKVTSVTAGTATITATATDGSNVSGSCKVTVTEPWKDFNVGDYVVRTSSGDIEFYADLSTAKSKGTVVGVVITQTNPRVTDPELPASCTHGIAIALGEGEGNWWSDSYHTGATSVSTWAASNGRSFVSDFNQYSGYTNTLALKAYLAAHSGLTSGIVNALNSYNGPTLPNNTSGYYLPSYSEMKDIAKISNGNFDFSNKLAGIPGTGFVNTIDGSNTNAYWTVSENGTSSAYATRALQSADAAGSTKTSVRKVRFVFAF